eukprot:TRINITY_DN83282_c0_g1_i1.p1 TRINITY_DN83282_c0_g1~~TRINITY_DN83282_c0_g1_i1.p1  ORF type:complete len:442 (+),score=115.09 TRINITY_DN83282_c0_g1_i1:84-1409(+)
MRRSALVVTLGFLAALHTGHGLTQEAQDGSDSASVLSVQAASAPTGDVVRHVVAPLPPWAAFRGAVRVRAKGVDGSVLAWDEPQEPSSQVLEPSAAAGRLLRREATRHAVPLAAEASLVALGEQERPGQVSKLFIVLTGDKPHKAVLAKDTWVKRVRWPDKVLFVCGPHCREDPRLDSVLIAPDLLRDSDSTQPWDYRQAAVRGPWALQFAWKNIERTGHGSVGVSVDADGSAEAAAEAEGYGFRLATQPFAWWIIADDDTFINLPVLDAVLQRYGADAPVVLAENLENGGAGIALSRAAAGNFSQHFWNDYLPKMRDVKGSVYGDHRLTAFLAMHLGATVDSPKEFIQEAPTVEQLKNGTYRSAFATWHHAWYQNDAKDYESYVYNGTWNQTAGVHVEMLPLQDRGLRDDIEHAPNTLEEYWRSLAAKQAEAAVKESEQR